MKPIFISILMAVGAVQASFGQASSVPTLIPMPVRADFHAAQPPYAFYVGTNDIAVLADENATTAADVLKGYLGPRAKVGRTPEVLNRTVSVSSEPKDHFRMPLQGVDVLFTTSDDQPCSGSGAYTLGVTANGIHITASDSEGMLYAVQTLRQLLPAQLSDACTSMTIPSCSIADAPALAWRGLMLDCSRHFYPVERIEQILDSMALLKFNRFHWHFIDNNGWRLQSDRYPKLTAEGAWRGPKDHRYGGYYTKDDVRRIVAYAARLGIEVIPEFEMPAHCDAALSTMPELTCAGTPYVFPEETTGPLPINSLSWFTKLNPSRPFCAGNDRVFEFYGDIFDEYLKLFPYKYWHVGGDERPSGRWSKCPKCQARMKDRNLADEHALQEWFMRKISDMLAARGKTAVSWAVTRKDPYNPQDLDELGNGAMLMNWHGGTKFAASHGRPIVNADNRSLYFDYPGYNRYDGLKRSDWMPVLPVEKVYAFNPVPDGLTAEQQANVTGAQCCVWTDFIPPEDFFTWTFPRVLATAEVCWCPASQRKDVVGFLKRVDAIEPLFLTMGIRFGRESTAPDANVQIHPKK